MTESFRVTWQAAADSLNDGVALVDAAGRVASCNRPFRRLLGLADDAPLVGGPIDAVLGAGDTLAVDGRRLELKRMPIDAGGDRAGTVVIVTDVTAAHRAAEALRAQNELFGALLRAAPLAIVLTDPNLDITLWNRGAEGMFGWTADELTGRPYHTLVPLDARASFQVLAERVLSGYGFAGAPAERLHKDGRRIPVRVSTAPVRDATGRVVGVVALIEDHTDRRRLEEQVRSIERMEAIGRLAGGVAHDFNNLLMVILAACDRLEAGAGDPAVGVRLAHEIRRAADRAAELTGQLLAYSRRQVLAPTRIDLNAAVHEAVGMLARVMGDDIALALELHAEPLPVRVDASQLQRVIVNLAVNARDAMPTGGDLRIATAATPDGRAALSVRDTGHGIAAEHLPHIFEPFFTTKEHHGTGLGLAMVYGFVRQSGGEVAVDSAAGRTEFWVHLPLDRASGASADPAEHGQAPATATVLLVEDQDDVRAAIHGLLLGRGYRVLEASDGPSALVVSDAHPGPIHLVLTDVVMPGPSGRVVADEIVLRRPEARVLFMSGHTDDEILLRGVRTSAASFVAKPFTAAALDAKVREILGVRGS